MSSLRITGSNDLSGVVRSLYPKPPTFGMRVIPLAGTHVRPSFAISATGPAGVPGADGAQGLRGLDGVDGCTGAQGPRGEPGKDGVQHFWAGSLNGFEQQLVTFSAQSAANSQLMSMKGNTALQVPSGAYKIDYTVNAELAAGTGVATAVVCDTNGPVQVSRAERSLSAESGIHEQFTGSMVKLYPNGTTLSLSVSGVDTVRNGSLFVMKLH